jgi:hypothetical protein
MGVAEIITIITSVITGLAKVTKVTREALAKSLEDMASDVRAGKLIPNELLAQVEEDSNRLDDIRRNLPDG